MDDDGKPVPRKQLWNRNAIGEIQSFELKARVVAENVEPGGLQLRIIVCVEVVEPDHAMAGLKQPLRDVKSDKSRSSRHQNCLIGHYACVLTGQYHDDASQYASDFGRPTPQYRNPFRLTSSGE